jgi:hypothetical protein
MGEVGLTTKEDRTAKVKSSQPQRAPRTRRKALKREERKGRLFSSHTERPSKAKIAKEAKGARRSASSRRLLEFEFPLISLPHPDRADVLVPRGLIVVAHHADDGVVSDHCCAVIELNNQDVIRAVFG